MMYLYSYISCFHNSLPQKKTDLSSLAMWEQLSLENVIAKNNKKRLSWDYTEYLITMLFLCVFYTSYVVISHQAVLKNSWLIAYILFVFLNQIVFFGIICKYSCRKRQKQTLKEFHANWMAQKKRYFKTGGTIR